MTRYVHHRLMGVAMQVVACVISAAVAFGVRGIPAVDHDVLWKASLFVLGANVLIGILVASRLKGIGELQLFDRSLRHNLVSTPILVVLLVPGLVMGLAVNPWLIRAGIAARWEKRYGVLLWRGHVPDRPWELSYSRPEAVVQP